MMAHCSTLDVFLIFLQICCRIFVVIDICFKTRPKASQYTDVFLIKFLAWCIEPFGYNIHFSKAWNINFPKKACKNNKSKSLNKFWSILFFLFVAVGSMYSRKKEKVACAATKAKETGLQKFYYIRLLSSRLLNMKPRLSTSSQKLLSDMWEIKYIENFKNQLFFSEITCLYYNSSGAKTAYCSYKIVAKIVP